MDSRCAHRGKPCLENDHAAFHFAPGHGPLGSPVAKMAVIWQMVADDCEPSECSQDTPACKLLNYVRNIPDQLNADETMSSLFVARK